MTGRPIGWPVFFVFFNTMPETKGVSLEDLQKRLVKQSLFHPSILLEGL